jgi:primosomal protein N' (replication factor Y)
MGALQPDLARLSAKGQRKSMRVNVVPLQPGLARLDYAVPSGLDLAPGEVVEVPLGPRRIAAVVWDDGTHPPADLPESRLRPVLGRLDVPPVRAPLRRLIDWVADYYLAPPGAVLRMALPRAAFLPMRDPPRFCPAPLPGPEVRLTGSRRALLEQLHALAGLGPAPLSVWAAAAGVSRARLRALAAAGLMVEVADAPAERRDIAPPPGPRLEPAQAEAAAALAAAVTSGGFQPVLLDGVTGSGKTEVYFEAIAAALAAGGQALVLLPEIALTEAWLKRFEARFGFAPALWHSSVTDGARRRAFRDLASGHARAVVGARSALFLPFDRLSLIIVDEAHDQAFKQEEHVPYHGRDVAVMRARFEEVPVVLATATPSLETLEQVARGTYRHLILPDRHGGRSLPEIRLIDMRKTPPARGRWLSPPVEQAVDETLREGGQLLLFLNRRGYAPLTLCRACGARIQCPNCTAWMVEHRLARRLMCHHCGHTMPPPPACPECGAEGMLAAIGPGVERLAEEVAARWPAARVAVVTSDTMSTRAQAAALLEDVAARRIDMLIGTQMLAKGHDFPGLTLVVVVDADLALAGGDLRAAERTYHQIAQVAGRAGRGDRPGRVLVQTHRPDEPVMQAIAAQARESFMDVERETRRAAGMPPFGRLAALIISGTDGPATEAAARMLARSAPDQPGIVIHGPAPAPLAMLRGRHRQRILVHAARGAALHAALRTWLGGVKLPASTRLTVDVDPQSFL